jgi:hypothetical protein
MREGGEEVGRSMTSGRNHALAFGVLASLMAVGHIGVMVSKSEAFVEEPVTGGLGLPYPPQTPIGMPLPDVTPPKSIVMVQTPPEGRRGEYTTNGWVMGTPEEVAARGIVSTAGRFHKPEMPFPKAASVSWYLKGLDDSKGIADVTFEDRTGDGRRKLVRVRGADARAVADLYLDGNSIRLKLPVGSYGLSVAVGRRWEGLSSLFGPYGSYFDLQPMDLTMTGDQVMYTRVLGEPRITMNGEGATTTPAMRHDAR